MFRNYMFSDPYNISGLRNKNNTPAREFNCGGFALGTFSWYCPHSPDDDCQYNYAFKTKEQAIVKTFKVVEYMLNDIPNLRIIGSLYDLRPNEYAIAFRISTDDDFHFVKRLANGRWTHKRGGNPIRYMSKEEVFSDCWFDVYSGPLVLLAMGR